MKITKSEQKTKRAFVGGAWINTVKNEDSKYFGVKYINISLDNKVGKVVLEKGDKVQLWPNKKRKGKQDADFRVSVLEDEEKEEKEETEETEETETNEAIDQLI